MSFPAGMQTLSVIGYIPEVSIHLTKFVLNLRFCFFLLFKKEKTKMFCFKLKKNNSFTVVGFPNVKRHEDCGGQEKELEKSLYCGDIVIL